MNLPNTFHKKRLLLLLIICSSISLRGQTIEKDSLAKYSFEQLSKKFYASKPDSLLAVLYANYYIKKAKREKDTIQIADGNYYLSDITKNSNFYVGFWDEIIKKTKRTKNKLYPTISYLDLGDYYYTKGKKGRALNCYLKAEIFLNKNDSLKYIIKQRIGNIKAHNGEIQRAIILYKEAYTYYKKKHKLNTKNIHNLFVNLSILFFESKAYDSSKFYNRKAYLIALKLKDSNLLGYSINRFATLDLHEKKYTKAINGFKKSIPYIAGNKNTNMVSQTYFYIAKSNLLLNKPELALISYIKIDSIKQATGKQHNSQITAYKFLANYYKDKKDDKKQLEYINKYIKVDSVLNSIANNVNKNLTENYDIPNLLEERKIIENRLKANLSTTKKGIILVSLFTAILSVILIYQSKRKKLYKQRFNNLIASTQKQKSTSVKMVSKKETVIPAEIINTILKLLIAFERNHEYIQNGITLSSLAKKFKTNTKYLSQIINQHKEKSFNNYINELRINYAVEKLKTDLKFRKYSINGIAEEVGFNTSESFSKAFYKNTGIKPSYFIKELEKSNSSY